MAFDRERETTLTRTNVAPSNCSQAQIEVAGRRPVRERRRRRNTMTIKMTVSSTDVWRSKLKENLYVTPKRRCVYNDEKKAEGKNVCRL